VHVSQWAVDESGTAIDSHELPGSALAAEVAGLVQKFGVEFVTIEYYKDRLKLVEALGSFRKILGIGNL
ncbi:MAG: hypothetical protein V2A70_09175, partial [Candidatus Omnitrophota bacterium]